MADFPLSLEWARRADGLLPVLRLGAHQAPSDLSPSGQAPIAGFRLTAWPPGAQPVSRVLQQGFPILDAAGLTPGVATLNLYTEAEGTVPSLVECACAGVSTLSGGFHWPRCNWPQCHRTAPASRLPADGAWVVTLEYTAARRRTSFATYAVTRPVDDALTLWVEREGAWMPAPTGLEGGTLTASGAGVTWTHAASRLVYTRWARRDGAGQVIESGTITPTAAGGTPGWESASLASVGGMTVSLLVAPRLRRRADRALLSSLSERRTPALELMLADALLSALEVPASNPALWPADPILDQLDALLPDDNAL